MIVRFCFVKYVLEKAPKLVVLIYHVSDATEILGTPDILHDLVNVGRKPEFFKFGGLKDAFVKIFDETLMTAFG